MSTCSLAVNCPHVHLFTCSYSPPGRPVRLQLFARPCSWSRPTANPSDQAAGRAWPLVPVHWTACSAAGIGPPGPRSVARGPRSWWPCLCLHVRLARVCDPGHKQRPGGRAAGAGAPGPRAWWPAAVAWWPTATWCLRWPGGQRLVDLVPGSWSALPGSRSVARGPPTWWPGPGRMRLGAIVSTHPPRAPKNGPGLRLRGLRPDFARYVLR